MQRKKLNPLLTFQPVSQRVLNSLGGHIHTENVLSTLCEAQQGLDVPRWRKGSNMRHIGKIRAKTGPKR